MPHDGSPARRAGLLRSPGMPTPTTPGPALDERLEDVLRRMAPTPLREIRPEHRLIEDLGFDSLALVKTVVAIEDAFGVELPQERLHELRDATVAKVASLVREAQP